MDHRLVANIALGLGWADPECGGGFSVGPMPDQDLPARLLTPTRLLDLLMRGALGLPQLRCLREGVDLHPNLFTETLESRRGQIIPAIDPRRLGRLLTEGVTVVADAVNTVDPTLEVACRALRWWTGELVRVNAYLTTGASTGFPLHWDDHDVIVVQVAGTKTWEVRGESRPVPMYRDAEPNTTPPEHVVWSGQLRPGDVMHIPRGHWHQASRADQGADGFSLHLTFGFTRQTGVDWLVWLADQARAVQLARTDLTCNGRLRAAAEEVDELATCAHELALSHTPTRMLAERRVTTRAARHVRTGGVFGPPEAVVAITEFPPMIQRAGDAVIVRGGGKEISCHPRAYEALSVLLSGRPVVLAQLAERSDVDVRALGARLVEEELCAEMTDALWSGYTGLVPNPM
jgi:hypothetical protein